ncbi:MAG: hypothetical protein EBR54_06920 [Flavobacteriia bacterium]|jgi:hypothetical protein|nr:hypothetical protein [Flavobacteriia bacterium]NBX39127.1 hypothetical protein [Flavobacteriia bacterium]
MDFNTELRFQKLIEFLKPTFEMDLDLTALIYLIGLNEAGFGFRTYTKQEKMDLMHIAVCTLLSPAGYYTFSHRDEQNWPHFIAVSTLPPLSEKEQNHILKEAVIDYFIEKEYVTQEMLAIEV